MAQKEPGDQPTSSRLLCCRCRSSWELRFVKIASSGRKDLVYGGEHSVTVMHFAEGLRSPHPDRALWTHRGTGPLF
jgi:hypothetical protein